MVSRGLRCSEKVLKGAIHDFRDSRTFALSILLNKGDVGLRDVIRMHSMIKFFVLDVLPS